MSGTLSLGDRENVFGFFFSYAAQVQTKKVIHTEGLVIVDIYCAWCFSAITIITNADIMVKIQNTKVRTLHRHGCSSEETAHISPGDTGSPPELTYNHPFFEVKENSKDNFCTAEQLTKYEIEK